jgi:serine/threonine protein kinase
MVSPTLQLSSPPAPLPSLDDLLASALVPRAEWDRFVLRRHLRDEPPGTDLLQMLVKHHLLTAYQAHRLAVGQRFGLVLGDYRVLDRVGSGSMAVIFRGEHCKTGRRVALKVLSVRRGYDKRVTKRFVQEVRITTRLRHPHIVHAVGAGAARSPEPAGPLLLYFVMEYVPGLDLETWVRQHGRMPIDSVMRIANQATDALVEAHRRRLVHRDITPSNIRLTPEGRVKLLDFGLARWGSDLDEPGQPLGTVAYMAPEQVRYADKVDVRADLYGLGGTLFWCLTGSPPFPVQGSALAQLAARLRLPPPSVRDYRPEVPRVLDGILRKLLALQPADRYETPGELQATLQRLL